MGFWGKKLAAAAERAPSVELVGLDDDPKAVVLATPNHLHPQHIREAVEAGRHVLVEKPLALTRAEGLEAVRLCQEEGRVLAVGHEFRFTATVRRLKALVEDGRLGRPVLAELNWSTPSRVQPGSWKWDPAACPGGPLTQLGVHLVDTARYLLGEVTGVSGELVEWEDWPIPVAGACILRLEDGALALISSSYASPRSHAMSLYGSEGVVRAITDMDVWPEPDRFDAATRLELHTREGYQELAIEPADPLAEELEDFAAAVREGRPPLVDGWAGLKSAAVIEAAIQSARSGQARSFPAEAGPW